MRPGRAINLVGQRHGRLVVLERALPRPGHKAQSARWLCRCDCGATKVVNRNSLRRGTTLSCGCLNTENRKRSFTIHGLAKIDGKRNPLYDIWSGMLQRCENTRHRSYKSYGARGILVCDAWHSFPQFVNDINTEIGARPSLLHTLDRKDNNGNYQPGNIRWATVDQQAANRVRRLDGLLNGIISMGS